MSDQSTIPAGDEAFDDAFERLGTRAGAELRAAAPPTDTSEITRTATRRRRTRTGAVALVVVLGALAGIALAATDRGPDRVETGPAEESSVTTIPAPSTGPPPERIVITGLGSSSVGPIDFSTDGRTGVSIADPGTASGGKVRVWDTVSGDLRQTIDLTSRDWPDEVFMSGDGERVAVRFEDGELRFWDIATKRSATPFPVPPAGVLWDGSYPQTFSSSDGRLRVELGRFGPVALADARTGEQLTLLDVAGTPDLVNPAPYTAAFNSDSSLLAVKFGERVQVWDTATYETVAVFELPDYGWTYEQIEFIADDTRLAFTVEDKVIIETVP
jgi:WD40 repeat protein